MDAAAKEDSSAACRPVRARFCICFHPGLSGSRSGPRKFGHDAGHILPLFLIIWRGVKGFGVDIGVVIGASVDCAWVMGMKIVGKEGYGRERVCEIYRQQPERSLELAHNPTSREPASVCF